MKDEIIKLIGNQLDDLKVNIHDVYVEKEGKQTYLRVVIDAEYMIDINRCVEATKIIDPIIEKADLLEDEYILDVYAKSKGDE